MTRRAIRVMGAVLFAVGAADALAGLYFWPKGADVMDQAKSLFLIVPGLIVAVQGYLFVRGVYDDKLMGPQ